MGDAHRLSPGFEAGAGFPPGQVSSALYELSVTGELGQHLGRNPDATRDGVRLGGALGLFVRDLAIGGLKRFEQVSRPLFQAVREIPSVALIPAFILVFGVDETFKIVLVSKASFFRHRARAFDGVRLIPKAYVEVAAVNRVLPAERCSPQIGHPLQRPLPLVAGNRFRPGSFVDGAGCGRAHGCRFWHRPDDGNGATDVFG